MALRTNRQLIGTREAAEILQVSQGRIRQLVLPQGKDQKPVLWSGHVGVHTLVVDLAEVQAYAADLEERRKQGKVRGPAPQGFRPDRSGPAKKAS